MAMDKSTTSSRVAMALMCGLAICCAVMYMTADGGEVVKDVPDKSPAPATSVSSEDVVKTGMLITETPDGRLRLTKYLSNVEQEIAAEEAARKRDVAEVRAQMARNFAFNKAARAKLEAALLAKMAANAKKAKADLDQAMRFVQGKFAAAAKLQNARNDANVKRSAQLRQTIAANKAEATKHLEHQVLVQQRAMSTLAAATNARIDKTDKNVAINSAQIKENAKKARQELDAAVSKFDQKVANARNEAAAGRSKLQEQLNNQDKSIRSWANNKLKIVMAKTAAQFAKVRAKMAADREHADVSLQQASMRMTASLNAFSALNDKRFKQTVADIEAAKDEADARIQAATTSYKVGIMKLTSTVNEQVAKTNTRISQLNDKAESNKVAQAKVNANVNAEMKRMVKLGNERYAEHMAKDADLKTLIDKNKAETNARIKAMGEHYRMELLGVRATMKKNRAHASHMLSKETAKLYQAIAKSEQEQLATNEALAEQTRRARLDIADTLRDAKTDFATRLGALHKTVVSNDKKFEGKILKLTGIVRENAVKNAQGRQELADVMDANKAELKSAVRDAIQKGEERMKAAEDHLVNLNKKTKAALNMKISTEISALTKRANSQIEGLRLSSKEARDEMKKELLYAVRSMAEEAKKNLDAAKDSAAKKFDAVAAHEADVANAAAEDREAIAQQIKDFTAEADQELGDAVATMHRSLLVLKVETEEKIKKTNTKVDAYAAALAKETNDVAEEMEAQMKLLTGAVEDQENAASTAINGAEATAAAAHKASMAKIAAAFKTAEAESQAKFGKAYLDMAKQRGELDENLAAVVTEMNDAIAKQAALSDARFAKTVKDLEAAKAEAHADVIEARKKFSTGLEALEVTVRAMDTRLTGEAQAVAGELISHQAAQNKVNRHVAAEIKRIEDLTNKHQTESIKARGKLHAVMNEYKRIAHDEVNTLDNFFKTEIAKVRAQADKDAEDAQSALADATEKMYEKLAEVQTENIYANEQSAGKITAFNTESKAGIQAAKDKFTLELDQLTRVQASHYEKMKANMQRLTGVIDDEAEAAAGDRDLIRMHMDAFEAEMRGKIVDAIQVGEAKAKAVEDRARAALGAEKQALLIEISNTVENMADQVFKTIQGKTNVIADNYLSLKAYAACAEDAVNDMVGKGHGMILSSVGDLLVGAAGLADVTPTATSFFTESTEVPLLFSGELMKQEYSVSKINGLVNEYTKLSDGVDSRWPLGLGRYLNKKIEASMRVKGVLKVDKVQGKAGNWVMIDSAALGMTNKMDTFEKLAVRMNHYEDALAKLTAKLSATKPESITKHEYEVPPPQWSGD